MLTLCAVAAGFLLDLLLGDPYWMPHPVRWMGAAIVRLERLLRRLFQPVQPGDSLLDGSPHGKQAGPVRLVGGGDGLCQLSHWLCLLYGLFPHQGPAYVFQVLSGFNGAYGV